MNRSAWVQILSLAITCSIASGKLLNCSVSGFFISEMGTMVVSTELKHVKCLQ